MEMNNTINEMNGTIKELKKILRKINRTSKEMETLITVLEKDNKDEVKEIKNDKQHFEILEHWNNKGFTKHKMNDKIRTHTNARLKQYTVDEIKIIIDTYSEIVKSYSYWYNHKFNLWDFLKYGYEKFIDSEVAKENFKIGTSKKPYVEDDEFDYNKLSE